MSPNKIGSANGDILPVSTFERQMWLLMHLLAGMTNASPPYN